MKRLVLPVMLFVLLFTGAVHAAERPNILWLSMEDISTHLGTYGHEQAVTPALDSLAAGGVRFDNAYAPAPVCAVARSALITGIYSVAQGSQFMRTDIVRPEHVMPFPHYLREAGYFTTNRRKTDYQFEIPEGTWDRNGAEIEDYDERPDPDQPFFSVINYGGTHESHNVGEYDPALFDPATLDLPPFYPDTPEVRRLWASYYQNIHLADQWVAGELERLEKAGLADDTIVISWADHGVGFPRGKRWIYNLGLKVPLIVHVPEKWRDRFAPAAPGEASDELVNFIDFAPTMLSIAGVSIPEHMQGRVFLGPARQEAPEYLYAHRDRMDERIDIIRTLIGKRFKYIRNYEYFKPRMQYNETAEIHAWGGITREIHRLHDAPEASPEADWFLSYKPIEELYDLHNDPDELHDLAADEAHAEKLAEMRGAFSAMQRRIGDLGAIPEPLLRKWRVEFGSEYEIREKAPEKLAEAWRVLENLHSLSVERFAEYGASDNAAARYWAAMGLGNLAWDNTRHLQVSAVLERMLDDPEPIVRIAAARGMLLIGESHSALKVLVDIIGNIELAQSSHLAAMLAVDLAGSRALPIREQLLAAEFNKKYPRRVRDELMPRIDSAAPRVPPPPPPRQTPSDLPNIVFILVDDMGWSDIGKYGGEIQTPNIDSLANEGLRFTQFHNTAKCFPSRATLLTGLYAQQVNMHRAPGSMQNATTLAEVLRSRGYRTLMVGKHHGTDHPLDFGFDRYYGLRDGASNHFNPGLQRSGEPEPAAKQNRTRVFCFDRACQQPWTPPQKDYYSTDYYTKWALDFLDEYQHEPRPYFLYLSFQAPHDPLQAWPDDIAKYRDIYKAGYEAIASARLARLRELNLIDGSWPAAGATHRDWDSLSEAEREDQALRMAIYAAMIDRVDQNVGKLLQKIDDMGEQDNTLILFASDNGSSSELVNRNGSGPMGTLSHWASLGLDWANVSNTPFRLYKNFSHQGGIATPLVVRWPAVITQHGDTVAEPGHFIDIMATFVDITGAEYPPGGSAAVARGESVPPLEGESLLPLLEGDRAFVDERTLYWQWQNGRAIRDGHWKLVSKRVRKTTVPEDWELYDMRVDKTETNDLSKSQPEVVARLDKMHGEWLDRVLPAAEPAPNENQELK
jgi:arylsulfatase